MGFASGYLEETGLVLGITGDSQGGVIPPKQTWL